MNININKSFKIKLALYLLLVALFILWLLFSNYIISLQAQSRLRPDDFSDELTKQGYSAIDTIVVNDESILEDLSMSGWAFIPTLEDNHKREVQLVFISSDNTYSVDLLLVDRPDVLRAYRTMFGDEYTKAVGYEVEFSTANMKNGIYDVYFYCKENDINFGLVSTGKKFLKQGKTFTEYIFESEQVDGLISQTDLIYSSVDTVSSNNSILEISGWGFVENTDCENQEVYVKIDNGMESKTYTTEQRSRPDVAEAYENEQYARSGYVAKIPLEQVKAGNYQLELFVKNGDAVASAIKGTIQITEDGAVTHTKV